MTRLDDSWIADSRSQTACALIADAGHQVFFVGGCVRNTLLGAPVSDIDLATEARPETVLDLAAAAKIKAVPTGLVHGTVTLVVGGRPFEVTTFRRDVETFGRHATVAFATDIAEDAARRDFTMNALYAQPDGTLVDPLGGLPDLREGRVRFVGDPVQRIAEDYLRILRFFRFFAWYGNLEAGPDPSGLAACTSLQGGLDTLSRERVGSEIARLLAAPDPAPAVRAMADAGILGRCLPGAEVSHFSELIEAEAALPAEPRWQRRLLSLGWRDSWNDQLRLSRADARILTAADTVLAGNLPASEAAYRFGADAARDAALVTAARARSVAPSDLEARIELGASAKFPVRARDLPKLAGPGLGAVLRALEDDWIASGFSLERDDLIARAPVPQKPGDPK